MCLKNVELNLKWEVKEKSFVGNGYKNMPRYANKDIGVWKRAVPRNSPIGVTIEKKTIYASDNTLYHPGFHIFLRAKDALAYGFSNVQYKYNSLYKVKYRTVTSFGKNSTTSGIGPCVVALEMKVVRELTKSEYAKLGITR